MELRQLRYFLKAGELLNFTEAAKAVHISQSTLSQQIKQLEDELGTPLFDRIGKRVILTEAGRHFTTYAHQTVASATSGLQILQDLAGLQTGELIIGVTFALRALLTPTLITFSNTYPGIKVKVIFGTSDELLEKLSVAQLDFVLAFHEKELKDPFFSHALFESRLALVVSSQSPLYTRTSITLPEISQLPLALPVQGYSTRQFLDHEFEKTDRPAHIQIEINDIPTLFELVRTGHWNTILLMATVSGQANLKAIPIEGKEMNIKARIIWLNMSYHKKAAVHFSDLLMAQLQA